MKVIIVKVVLPLPIRKYFEYIMPPNSAFPVIGGRILVPFRSKYMIGIVIAFVIQTEKTQLNLKYAKKMIDNQSFYTSLVLDILIWISRNYYCPIGIVFFSILPKKLFSDSVVKDKIIYKWSITKKGKESNFANFKKRKKQFYTLLFLKKQSILSFELKTHNLSRFILKKLHNQGLCKLDILNSSSFIKKPSFKSKRRIFLNRKYLTIIDKILIKKNFSSWLFSKHNLYGKIKFYLHLIKTVLDKEMQILILVPHIKNINIMVVFLKKFFDVTIDSIHSELSNTKYLKNWIRTKKGENSIVIGTNKSIFLPFLKLGIILLFEEHNLNYKNITQCSYNFRDIGIFRAYKEKIPIILDSDTPSLKTLYNILSKKCFYITTNKLNHIIKYNNSIINLKQERIRFGLSLTLINEIIQNYEKKQVLLIFNQVNFLFFLLKCNRCGSIFKCNNCHVYFELNQYRNVLFCKFCLIKIGIPSFCYNCGCLSLIVIKISIEKIKNIIQNIFPDRIIFFLLNKKDINKNMFNKNCFDFSIVSPCIIFTTEKIVQNYYFPFVSLIALTSIDNYFFSFKFRKLEYFAQFYFNLIQLTKYKKTLSKIIIQTSYLENINLKELCNNTYNVFANQTLLVRKNFFLPPWSCQVVIYSENKNPEKNIIFLNLIREIFIKQSTKYSIAIWFVGPHPIFILQLKKQFYQLLVQFTSRIQLNKLLNQSIEIINLFPISKRIKWFIEIDPN